ncbi:uncharacterized protein LOC130247817 [Danio aesculapii]|uniref:uncharacterized protein LOC130247817 n=1 Tax=Danio aesculapii TaxID=1142201 RepID=UPI0024BFF075|nr:uncharacterized protein LOC130247817 [Danio aesculapii]
MDFNTDLNTHEVKCSTNETIIIHITNDTDINNNALSSNESTETTLETKFPASENTSFNDTFFKPFDLGEILRIPYFGSTFHSNEILLKSLNKLKSTSGPLVIQDGQIMPNYKNVKLTHRFACCVLVFVLERDAISLGQGFYYGSNLIMTAKHVLKNPKECSIYVIFPDDFVSVIFKCNNTLPKAYNRVVQNYDIAFIELEGNLDLLQNKELQIGELRENDDLFFYTIKSGRFFEKPCRIKQPNSDIKKKMLKNEFILSDAGEDGDSGTPIYSRSGTCVGLYIGAHTEQNFKFKFGRALQFDKEVLKKLKKNITLSVPKLLILFPCLIIFVFLYILLYLYYKNNKKFNSTNIIIIIIIIISYFEVHLQSFYKYT